MGGSTTADRARIPAPIALEITPPRSARTDVLLRRARLLNPLAALVNVVDRPGRLPSLDACLVLAAWGHAPVWHVATRRRTAHAFERELERARRAGVRALLCVAGDGAAAGEGLPVGEAVARARSALPWAEIGVAVDPGREPEREVSRARAHLRAGASFVQTQLVFEPAPFCALALSLRRARPGVRVVPMVMPLLSAAQAQRISVLAGVRVPRDAVAAVALGGPERGWRRFRETLRAIHASRLADALAVMTYEADPPAGFGARLREELLGGWPDSANSVSTASPKAASSAGR